MIKQAIHFKRSLKVVLFIAQKRGLFYVLKYCLKTLRKQPVDFFFELRFLFYNKRGIEIGGPSKVFLPGGLFPIIEVCKEIDNVNYKETTIWGYSKSSLYRKTIICEASCLGEYVGGEKYDFLCTSNVIEHLANPLKALFKWKHVIKKGGIMVIVFPNKDLTFDHRRPPTTIKHIIDDFKNDVDEKDLSHLVEIMKLHDITLDPHAGTFKDFVIRSLKNYEYRCLHHHVFTLSSLTRILTTFLKMEIIFAGELPLNNLILVAKRIY